MLKKESGRTQVEILKDIVDSLKQAEGASSQLVHAGGHPTFWMQVRSTLELMQEGVQSLAPKGLMKAPTPKVIV